MVTRFMWKMCLRSSSLEADRAAALSFWPENRSEKTHMKRTTRRIYTSRKGPGGGAVLTSVDDGLHCELVAALPDAAVERGDVLLLSERVGVGKHGLDLSHVALLKAPAVDRGEEEKKR